MTEPEKNFNPLLTDIGLTMDLYLSLNYHDVRVPQQGLWAKLKKKTVSLDLDLGCLLFDQQGEHVETVWFKNLRDTSQAIRHYGDELHGIYTTNKDGTQREMDDNVSSLDLEYIHLNLIKLPHHIQEIALVINSFQGMPIASVPDGGVELQDVEGNTAIRVELPFVAKDCSCLWIGSLLRVDYLDDPDKWQLFDKQQPLVHNSLDTLADQVRLA